MEDLPDISRSLERLGERLIPRILTQACRDPNSECYGSFDRDWWHYKIRDFPSVILQQAGYSAWLARELPGWSGQAEFLTGMARAACLFWNRRARRHHAFEEYYPWESGYPPLAFSTLAVMKLAAAGVVDKSAVRQGAEVAARQLNRRFERQAANQQVAGLAALAWLKEVYPDLVAQDDFASLQARTLALQIGEGWFEEYDGPDLGYLSVTLDCLWDLYDATKDEAFLQSASRALSWLATCVLMSGSSAGLGMHNSRNTDYLLPYGIARFIKDRPSERPLAEVVLRRIYGDMNRSEHFLHAVDDRYFCHYTGHSLIRACLTLRPIAGHPGDGAASKEPDMPAEKLFEGSGHYFRKMGGVSLVISLNKGGILTLRRGDSSASDFGWLVRQAGNDFVSHWWSRSNWKWSRDGDGWVVRGTLVPAKEEISTPWKHGVLRLAGLLLGSRIVKHLKNRLIFAVKGSIFQFERRIQAEAGRIRVDDRISGLPEEALVLPAPRACRRHVASADAWHPEDVAPQRGARVERSTRRADGTFSATTIYALEETP